MADLDSVESGSKLSKDLNCNSAQLRQIPGPAVLQQNVNYARRKFERSTQRAKHSVNQRNNIALPLAKRGHVNCRSQRVEEIFSEPDTLSFGPIIDRPISCE